MKFIPSAILLLGFLTSSQAQVSVLMLGGMNFSRAAFDPDPPDYVKVSSRLGFNAGGMLDMGGPSKVHVLLGAGFDTRGYVLKEEGFYYDDDGIEVTFKANYISVPILLSFRPDPSFFLNAGFEPAFKVSANVESGGSEEKVHGVEGQNLGLRAEVGFLIPAKGAPGNAFVLGLGYTYGLSDIFEDDSGGESKYRVFRIFAGLSFGSPPKT